MTFDEIVRAVRAQIRSCESCQPFEDGTIRWEYGEPQQLDHLFDELAVPEELRDRVASVLKCPRCGMSVFERSGEYGAPTEWDRWYEGDRYILDEFGNHLSEFPSLGLQHELGREILDAVATLPRYAVPRSDWWRARHPHGPEEFGPRDLLPPPPEVARAEGRFNYSGQRAFYLASSVSGALAEILDNEQGQAVAWVQQFEFMGDVEVLDVRPTARSSLGAELSMSIWGLLQEYLPVLRPKRSAAWKPSYIVTRFIADAAKYHGLAGLVTRSVRYSGDNLILFDAGHLGVRPVGRPTIHHVPLPPKSSDSDAMGAFLDFDDDFPF
jgi:hypothetical protein